MNFDRKEAYFEVHEGAWEKNQRVGETHPEHASRCACLISRPRQSSVV